MTLSLNSSSPNPLVYCTLQNEATEEVISESTTICIVSSNLTRDIVSLQVSIIVVVSSIIQLVISSSSNNLTCCIYEIYSHLNCNTTQVDSLIEIECTCSQLISIQNWLTNTCKSPYRNILKLNLSNLITCCIQSNNLEVVKSLSQSTLSVSVLNSCKSLSYLNAISRNLIRSSTWSSIPLQCKTLVDLTTVSLESHLEHRNNRNIARSYTTLLVLNRETYACSLCASKELVRESRCRSLNANYAILNVSLNSSYSQVDELNRATSLSVNSLQSYSLSVSCDNSSVLLRQYLEVHLDSSVLLCREENRTHIISILRNELE